LKISEYEVQWLMDFPLINIWAPKKLILAIILSFEAVSSTLKKHTNKYKEKLAIIQSIGILIIYLFIY